MTSRLLTALTATALLAAPAATASAQGAPPAPGCYGMHIADKAGDSTNSLMTTAGGPAQPGSPSSDLIGGWIDYDASAHKGTANIQVDNLTEGEIDQPYVAISWEYSFNTSAGARFVRAYQDASGTVEYTWGEPRAVTDDQTTPRIAGDTTGALFPGKGGVIRIDLPLAEADFGGKPGTGLKSQALEVRQWASLPAAVPNTGLPLYSPAPIYDDAVGKVPFTFEPCGAPKPVTPGAPTTAPTGDTPAPSTQGGSFDVKVTVPKLSAKKLKKAKKFTIKLSGNATELKAVVRKKLTGGKNLASGKLAALKGKGKMTLKGKLKKGSYVLVFSGKNAQGQTSEGAVKIKVAK